MLRFLLVLMPMLLSAGDHPSRKRPSEQAPQQQGAPEHKKRKVEPTGQGLKDMLVDQQGASGPVKSKPILIHAP